MPAKHLRNIPLKLYRDFLKEKAVNVPEKKTVMNIGQEKIYSAALLYNPT